MNDKYRKFAEKNLTKFHIIGMLLGWIMAFIYWHKSGHLSDNILKNNPVLISLWGIALGYISFDLIIASSRKKDKENN